MGVEEYTRAIEAIGSDLASELGDLVSQRTIGAVYDEDLDALLERLGIAEPLRSGSLACALCGQVVTRESLGCLYPWGNEIAVCCDSPSCLEQVPAEVIP